MTGWRARILTIAAVALVGAGSAASATAALSGGSTAARKRPYPLRPYPVLAYPIVAMKHARLTGRFLMHGRITAAVGVRGERRGQRITRTWVFGPRACGRHLCRRVVLKRERSAGRLSRIVLRRHANGSYRGRGVFVAPLRCLGLIYAHGETAHYTLSVRIAKAYVVDGVRFAAKITARYRSTRRIDHTRCPLGPSHDAATYVGVLQSTAYP